MTRYLIFMGVVAATVISPAVTLAVPTGAFHRAPVLERSAPANISTRSDRGSFKVPFDVDVRPKPLPQAEHRPPEQWHPWTWKPNLLWYPNACVVNGSNWSSLAGQPAWTDQSAPPGFTIGSLAGDPSHSIFNSSASSYNTVSLESPSNALATQSSSPISFQYGLQPTLCNGPFAGF